MSRARPLVLILVLAGLAALVVVLQRLGPVEPGASLADATPSSGRDARDAEELPGAAPETGVASPTIASERTVLDEEAPSADEASTDETARPTVDLLVLVDRGQAGRAPLPGVTIRATRGESLGDPNHRTLDLTGNAPSGPDRPVHVGETDARGRLTAELPRTGWFVFHPDPASLPEGVAGLAEFGLDRELGSVHSNGAYAFTEGERAEVTLLLPAAGELVVTVRDAGGAPVEDATVQLALRADLEQALGATLRLGREKRRSTDPHGRAVFERVPQGVAAISVEDPVVFSDSFGSGNRRSISSFRNIRIGGEVAPQPYGPAPVRRTLPAPRRLRVEGGRTAEVEVRLGAGAHQLVGSVVDEDGAPIVGTRVSIHYVPKGPGAFDEGHVPLPSFSTFALATTTDGAGRFEVRDLDPGPYRLRIEHSLDAGAFGLRTEPVSHRVDAAGPGEAQVDAGAIVVPRPHLFVVSGRVVLTAAKREGVALSLANVRPWVISSRGGAQLHWSYDDETGEFTAACVLPFPPIRLRVGQYQGAEHYREYDFVPEAGVTLENVELRYP